MIAKESYVNKSFIPQYANKNSLLHSSVSERFHNQNLKLKSINTKPRIEWLMSDWFSAFLISGTSLNPGLFVQ